MRNRIIRPEQKKRMPIIGKVKCGEIVEKAGKEYPTSLDYFVADGNYKHLFDQKFKKPDKLDICFISDDPTECCVERLEIRKGSKLYARGDGFTFEVWDTKAEKYVLRNIGGEPDLIEKIEKATGSQFDEILDLFFLIIGFNEVFGVWKFSTKGKESSIPAIISSFDKVLEIAGRIKFIPFTLSVQKVKSQKPDSKNLFPVVSLVANIGQEYLDKLQAHINGGVDITGIITHEKIDSVQQIEYKEEPKTSDIDYEFNIVPSLKEKIKLANDMAGIKNIGMEINSMDLPDNYKNELRQDYQKRLNAIKGAANGVS